MNSEFEQLLEDLLSGRLDEAGRRRLDELTAAQPALAARLRKERNLNYLLSRCGPNHAPADLAGNIMARLETRVRVRAAGPWYGWIFQPAFQAALACVVLLAIGLEAGLLIARRNGAATVASAEKPIVPEQVKVLVPKTEKRVAAALPETHKKTPTVNRTTKNITPTPVAAEAPPPYPFNVTEFPTGPNTSPQGFGEFPVGPVAPVAPTVDPSIAAVSPMNPATALNPSPAVPNPAAAATPKPAAAVSDRLVAMQITLDPRAPLPASKPQEQGKSVMGLPGAIAFDNHTGRPKAEPLALKDIEMAVYAAAPDTKIAKSLVIGRPNAQLVSFTMTPRQFHNFMQQLRGTGIQPTAAPQTSSTTANQPGARGTEPSAAVAQNTYSVIHGKTWLTNSAVQPPAPAPGAPAAPASDKLLIRIVVEQIKP